MSPSSWPVSSSMVPLGAVDDLGGVDVAELVAGELLDGALGIGDEALELLGGVGESRGDLGDDVLNVHVLPFGSCAMRAFAPLGYLLSRRFRGLKAACAVG